MSHYSNHLVVLFIFLSKQQEKESGNHLSNLIRINDAEINGLAMNVFNGEEGAGDAFAEAVYPLLKRFASRVRSSEPREDQIQMYFEIAWKIAHIYGDKYLGQNFMPIVYKSCKNHTINQNIALTKTAKRGSGFITKSTEETVGQDSGDSDVTVGDLIKSTNLSIEDEALGNLGSQQLLNLLEEYSEISKNRKNSVIVQAKALHRSNQELAYLLHVLFEDGSLSIDDLKYNGKYSKAVSRAIKDFTDFLHSKNYIPECP